MSDKIKAQIQHHDIKKVQKRKKYPESEQVFLQDLTARLRPSMGASTIRPRCDRHIALLSDSNLSHHANNIQRTRIANELQSTYGNAYVQRVLTEVQAKLKIGQPEDIYKQEANATSQAVMQQTVKNIHVRDNYKNTIDDEAALQKKHETPDCRSVKKGAVSSLAQTEIITQPFFKPSIGECDLREGVVRLKTSAHPLIQRFSSDRTRRLTRNVGTSIRVGSRATYQLEQIGDEISSADTVETYRWRLYRSTGDIMWEDTRDEPRVMLRARYPGDYRIEVGILRNGSLSTQIYDLQQNVFMERLNTELGQLSVGNFDFRFDGSTASVVARVKFQFDDSITSQRQMAYKRKFFRAIRSYWTNSGYGLRGEGNCSAGNVPIVITAVEVMDDSYHKIVDVDPGDGRQDVISDMNLYENANERRIAHEFGHVLGLYDEYDGGFFENLMFWHDNSHLTDVNALMNRGRELRPRYFEHFRDAAQLYAIAGCNYVIAAQIGRAHV